VNFEINSVLPSLLLVFVEKVLTCLFTPPLGNFQLGDVAGSLDSVRWRTGLSGVPIDSSLPQRLNWWLGL
jgi:hypothetical protein